MKEDNAQLKEENKEKNKELQRLRLEIENLKTSKDSYAEKVKGSKKKTKRKEQSRSPKRKGHSKNRVAKVRVTLDMWEVMKNGKKIYDCPFTLWIDGENYNHSKVSVFEPEDALDKLKNEIVPYFKNFLN